MIDIVLFCFVVSCRDVLHLHESVSRGLNSTVLFILHYTGGALHSSLMNSDIKIIDSIFRHNSGQYGGR
jgi:hypothetical protein